jgi:MoxR-like ATPase
VAYPVLRHRVLPNFAAEGDGITAESVVDEVLSRISPPRSELRL